MNPADSAVYPGQVTPYDLPESVVDAEMEACPVPSAKETLRAEAYELASQATHLRDGALLEVPELPLGRGGELASAPDDRMPPPELRDVVAAVRAPPTLMEAEASVDRLRLARDAGALSLAVDAAEAWVPRMRWRR
jgi:hypothetical protein